MKRQRKCHHCLDLFLPDPRSYSKTVNGKKVSVQHYCSKPDCRRESQRQSHRSHVQQNPRYRQKMMEAARRWRKKNSTYWRARRQDKPEVARRNRLLQRRRDSKAKADLANINSIGALHIEKLHRIDILIDLANINPRDVSWTHVSEEIIAFLRWSNRLANIKAIDSSLAVRHNVGHETNT